MLEENKNLKNDLRDTSYNLFIKDKKVSALHEAGGFHLGSYTKTNKLICAMYMVTDIMDKEEPIRNKLRILGTGIISDIYSFNKGQDLYSQINNRVSEIMSFIGIASSVGIISEMNANILIKEFNELKKAILEAGPLVEENWLQEFMKGDDKLDANVLDRGENSIRQIGSSSVTTGTRIGVQKGSTLLQALSDKIPDLRTHKITIQRNFTGSHPIAHHDRQTVDVLKNKRREEIILVIKDKMKSSINFDGATITDIKSNGHEMLASCGEKTLQRELVSMVSSGVLKKTGEKRWSRYSIKN